jgi:hypothetical protein
LFLLVLCTRCSTLCATHTAAEPCDVSSELLHPREIFRRQKRNNCSYSTVRIELSWTFPLSLEKKVKQNKENNSSRVMSFFTYARIHISLCAFARVIYTKNQCY